MEGQRETGDSFANQRVFVRRAVVGVVAGQQGEVDARRQVAIGLTDQGLKIGEILLVLPVNVQVAENEAMKLVCPRCFLSF